VSVEKVPMWHAGLCRVCKGFKDGRKFSVILCTKHAPRQPPLLTSARSVFLSDFLVPLPVNITHKRYWMDELRVLRRSVI